MIEKIARISIDDQGQLFVTPQLKHFDQIFRAAMGVYWEDQHGRLRGPKEMSQLDQFNQIAGAAESEYGTLLVITWATVWSEIPDELKMAISAANALYAGPEQVKARHDARIRASAAYTNELLLSQDLREAAQLWDAERYADYVDLLVPREKDLSPAQLKRLNIARKRSRQP